MNKILNELVDLAEAIMAGEEQLGEIQSEHASECAAYGDSWPGALQQIRDMRDGIEAMKDRYDALLKEGGFPEQEVTDEVNRREDEFMEALRAKTA